MGEADSVRGESARRALGRQGFLAGGLGALLGSLVGRVSSAHAAAGEPLILGQDNVSDASTGLSMTGPGPALRVDGGHGIQIITDATPLEAHGSVGPGLWGTSVDDPGAIPSIGAGVIGEGQVGIGGLAKAPANVMISIADFGPGSFGAGDRFGNWGHGAPSNIAISLVPDFRAGSVGVSDRIGIVGFGGSEVMISVAGDFRAGVAGAGDTGVWGAVLPLDHRIGSPAPRRAGVLGTATPDSTAVLAENPGGLALKAIGDSAFEGDVAFSMSGSGVIPAGQTSLTVNDPNVRPGSRVHVTLNGNPGSNKSALWYVEVQEGALKIVLQAAPKQNTPFTYLVHQAPG